jgi:TrwC relaxase
MVKAIRYCGKIYQSALRRKVEELGYRTRDKLNERGQLEGFEIDGISDELCEKYSQRRGEIEERIADFKAEHGREPTSAEIHVIAKETRTSKLIEISIEAVRAQQLERASAEEFAQIDQVKAQAYAREENQPANTDATELVCFVRDHLAERRATFGEHDLIAEALNLTADTVQRGVGSRSRADRGASDAAGELRSTSAPNHHGAVGRTQCERTAVPRRQRATIQVASGQPQRAAALHREQ